MSRYQVIVLEPAAKVIEAIRDKNLRTRLVTAIDELENDPRPQGVIKLKGKYDQYRIRVGTWRIIYTIEDDKLVVLIVTVGQRKDVYR